MMTKERAEFILSNRLRGGDFPMAFVEAYRGPWAQVYEYGITKAEDRYVRQVWSTQPGSTTYYDALARIARGEVPS